MRALTHPRWRTRPPILVIALTVGGLVPSASALEAQLAGLGGPLAQSDMLYLAGKPELAHNLLKEYLATDSTDYGALWRLARARVVIGLEMEGSRQQNVWLDPAIEYADRAVAIDPEGVDGRYWRGVAAGRRAMNASPGYAVELAQIVYDDAHAILEADSLHGGAHNMLGKLNYEVMSLSRIKRAIARAFMGNDALSDTSWENAEYHLARATETWPDFVLFHFDLAQLYRKRGREQEAVASYRRALALPTVHPTDHRLQLQAEDILHDWGVPLLPEDGAADNGTAVDSAGSVARVAGSDTLGSR